MGGSCSGEAGVWRQGVLSSQRLSTVQESQAHHTGRDHHTVEATDSDGANRQLPSSSAQGVQRGWQPLPPPLQIPQGASCPWGRAWVRLGQSEKSFKLEGALQLETTGKLSNLLKMHPGARGCDVTDHS